MRKIFLVISFCFSIFSIAQDKMVNIEVDLNKEMGELKPIWAWFGYDEPNYTDPDDIRINKQSGHWVDRGSDISLMDFSPLKRRLTATH